MAALPSAGAEREAEESRSASMSRSGAASDDEIATSDSGDSCDSGSSGSAGPPSILRRSRPRRGAKRVRFAQVTVYYFARRQGFTCVPSAGGSSLGMAPRHHRARRYSLSQFAHLRQASHRQHLRQHLRREKLRARRRELTQNGTVPSAEAAGLTLADVSDDDLDVGQVEVGDYFYLQPLPTKRRRALLRASGVRSGLSRLSGPAQSAWGAGLHCGQTLGVGTWLLMDPGKVCLSATRSLFTLLAALWDSLAGSVLRVRELLAAFLALVATRATAVSIRLWLQCQLAVKLLCSATMVFISIYFLAIVCHSGAQSLGTPFVTLWNSLTNLIFGVTDLLAAFLAHVSGAAITVSMLLWWLCQMAFEFLCSISKVFISICFLVSSLVRSLLSLCLMGTQYLPKLLAVLWDLLSSLLLGVTNVLVMVLAYLFRALFILLWLPFQLAFILLSFVTQVFTSIFFVGVYILGLLLRIVFLVVLVVVIYCNQEVLWMLKGRVLGSSRRLQPVLRRLYQVAMVTLRRASASQPWRRLVDWVLTNWSQAGRRTNQGREQLDAGQVPQPRPAVSCAGAGQHLQTPRDEPGTSWWRAPRKQHLNATAGSAEGTSGNNPWVLLKEQEERKKCVICQDQTKTVLLLPCRHLCLCQECTEVLLQQDIYQRNCPLCRQVILQTLNVYL